MQRTFLIAASLIIAALILLWFLNIKKSWETLPVYPATEMPGASFQNWNMFNDPEKEFQVMFPTEPKNASKELRNDQTAEVSKQHVFVSEKNNGSIYMISRVEFPNADLIKDNGKVLKSAIDDLVQANPDNTLLSSKEQDYQGKKAVHFEIRNKDIYTQGIAFLRGRSLYVLTAISNQANRDDKEFQNFIASFQYNKAPELTK